MKKILFIILLVSAIASCKDENKQVVEQGRTIEEEHDEQDTVPTLTGNFVFTKEDAILRGEDFIYNVEIDSLSRALAVEIEAYKTDDLDMIPVKVKGKLKQSPRQTGIERNIELREIVAILADTTANIRQE